MTELPSIDEAVMEGDARHSMDKNLRVEFYAGVRQNEIKSAEAGRPIFDDADFVRINIPGDVKSSYVARVTAEHKMRFPMQWQAYLIGASQDQQGIPLEKLPGMSLSLAASLRASNITTIEQLATLSDSLATGLHGINELRRKAQAMVALAKGNEAKEFVNEELAKRDAEISELRAQMASLLESKAVVEAPKQGKAEDKKVA